MTLEISWIRRVFLNLTLRFYSFIFREGVGWEEKETSMSDRNINQLPLTRTQPGTEPAIQATCPDPASNWWPFACQDDTQPTEPHQSGPEKLLKTFVWYLLQKERKKRYDHCLWMRNYGVGEGRGRDTVIRKQLERTIWLLLNLPAHEQLLTGNIASTAQQGCRPLKAVACQEIKATRLTLHIFRSIYV